jgi:hypothetical protein
LTSSRHALPPAQPTEAMASSNSDVLLGWLNAHGSDKGYWHKYHHVYASVMRPGITTSVLEIGIGTNNPGLISTMGPNGKPGASLRAWANYLPGARIYGADVDHDILFSTDRITTAHVDQLNVLSLETLPARLGVTDGFDVIIDDGLHALGANLATLVFGLNNVRVGGAVIIEDLVAFQCMDPWRAIDAVIVAASKDRIAGKKAFTTALFRGRTSYLYVVTRIQ